MSDLLPLNAAALAGPPTREPVVIYDSGVGGLTVALRLAADRPSDDLLYVADNSWFPYGLKADLLLRSRIYALLHEVVEVARARAVVVACNTASTAIAGTLDDLGSDVPIYTVVPPIPAAVRATPHGRIALLSTPATARRALVRGLLERYGAPGQITLVPTIELVHLAERKLGGEPVSVSDVVDAVNRIMPARDRAGIQGVILGCTHFPWLRDELAEAFPAARSWSDPAAATARQVLANVPPLDRSATWLGARDLALTGQADEKRIRSAFARHGFSTAAPWFETVYPRSVEFNAATACL